MTGPIVVGSPTQDVVVLAERLAAGGIPGGTVIWPDPGALRDASDDLAAHGWDVLVVDPGDEPLSTAAMGHRSQIHGVPPVVVVHGAEGADPVPVATMVLRHLPDVPVVVMGPASGAASAGLAEVAEDLELALAEARDADDLRSIIDRIHPTPAPHPKGN